MTLYVHKHPEDPSGVATCIELQKGQTPPGPPWELMSVQEFEAWAAPYRAEVETRKAAELEAEQITPEEVPQRLDAVQAQVDQLTALIQELREIIKPNP